MKDPARKEAMELLIELGLVSSGILEECLGEASASGQTVWKLLRARGLINQPQADSLEMAAKGYIPIDAARVSVLMHSTARPANAQKTRSEQECDQKTERIPTPVPATRSKSGSSSAVRISHEGISLVAVQRKDPPHTAAVSRNSGAASMPTEPAVFASQVAASPRPGMSGLLGREIGQYRIASQLGKGACGTVYLAHHKMLNMPVAVKVLDPMHAKHAPEILRRFLHEARTAARVVHPNLVRVLDCGELNSLHFIVMEFVDGVSVLELIRMNGRLSEDTALSIVFAVAEGLEAALAEGIVHRDIKPANIMITKTKQVKLADMGLAKISNDEWSETAPNTGMGTPHYFAPEQAEDASAVDHRADIYSLGCSFYHMLYGKVPFEAQTIAEMIYKHRYEMPVPLVRAVPGITPELSILVDRMMAKQPVDRPQTYQDIIRSLQECRLSQRSTESRGASTSFMRRFLDGIFPGSRAGG